MRTGVLRNWPLALPWAPDGAAVGHNRRVGGTGYGPARGQEPGPSLISPAHQDAKLEDLKGLPGGRLGTTRQFRPYLSRAGGGSTASELFTRVPQVRTQPRAGPSRAEAAVALSVRPQRAQEVDPPESGPVGVAEVELRVGALPEQETAQALLAGGPDDQVWIGLPGRVQVLGDVFDVQYLGKLLDRGAPAGVLLQQ